MSILEPGEFPLRQLFEEWIEEDLEYIRFLHTENKVFQGLREKHQGEWEVVELCREALFDNAKLIENLKKRTEDVRAEIKKLG